MLVNFRRKIGRSRSAFAHKSSAVNEPFQATGASKWPLYAGIRILSREVVSLRRKILFFLAANRSVTVAARNQACVVSGSSERVSAEGAPAC